MTALRSRRSRRRGGIKLIIMFVLAAVVGAGASYALLGRGGSEATAKSKSAKKGDGKGKPKSGEKGVKGEDGEAAAEIVYVNLGPFLVNLVANDTLRYLRAEVTLGVEGLEKPKGGKEEGAKAKAPALPPNADAVVRDIIVRVLSRQTFDELRLQGPRDELKKLVLKDLTGKTGECKAVDVLFTSFVMQ